MSDPRRLLLEGLFDFAGLFPPASLDVPGAVAAFRAAREHPHGWLVERFVASAAQVEAVGDAAGDGGEPWPVTVVVEAPALRATAEAAGRVASAVRVDVVELKPVAAGELAGVVEAARTTFPGTDVAVEVRPGDEAVLDALAEAGAWVKLRCGGEHVPSAEEVAAVLRGCAERGLAVKATAGLHHPVAAPDGAGLRHGFLNLLAAAALGGDVDAVRETDPSAFVLGDGGMAWRGQAIDAAVARRAVVGIGSCSFDEPVADLVALEVLAPAATAPR